MGWGAGAGGGHCREGRVRGGQARWLASRSAPIVCPRPAQASQLRRLRARPTCRLGLTLTVARGTSSRLRLSCWASVFCARRLTRTLPSNTPRPLGADTMHLRVEQRWGGIRGEEGEEEGAEGEEGDGRSVQEKGASR